MFNFTISTDNVAEAQAIINAMAIINTTDGGTKVSNDIPSSTPTPTPIPDQPVTPEQIAEILKKLSSMSADALVDEFGEGNDKPYRVIKNLSLPVIARQLGVSGFGYYVETDYDTVINAIQFIVKDVSVGGITHDQMEELFGVRTSKNLFKEFDLDDIVAVLQSEDLI